MATAFPDIYPVPLMEGAVEVHINRLFDRVVACANHRRETLLIAAHEKRQEMAARVRERAESEQQLLAAKAEIERHLRENFLQDTQERILAEIEYKLALVRVPVSDTYIVFRGECEQMEQLIARMGEILEMEVPVVPRYQDMRPIVAVSEQGKAPSELWYPHGVAINPTTNHIYVAEGDFDVGEDYFARVSIFSERGDFLNSYTHEHKRSLQGIAIKDNNLYVTDRAEHAVFQVKIGTDFRLVARLGSKGTDIGQFKSPRQLSISTNGDLYIADWGNNRIQILDSSLHPIREITHPSMHYPRDVKLAKDEVYVLSDWDNPGVHVFSYTGHKIRSLITRGEDMQIIESHYFCLDPNKNLIISDCHASQIKIFSNEGVILHTLGQHGEAIGMFDCPTGLALTSDLKIVSVSLNKFHGLQIFSSM